MRAVQRWLLVVGAAAVVTVGCSSTSSTSTGTPTYSSSSISGSLRVDAAASLKTTFDQIAAQFEQANPGVEVSISYDGSAVLATQILAGAPVDVFASADKKNMTRVTDPQLIDQAPVEFATNTLQIAVAAGNPKKITGLADLAAPGLNVDLCATAQPCGAAAQTALKAAGVTVTPVSSEQNVTAVLTKVESGDADAGLVYRTDVLGAAGKVTGVDFPQAAKAVNHYPIGALANSNNAVTAKAFIAFVVGKQGQHILANAGFGKPTP